jgi:HK97 gp10 family phage protein
MAADGIMLKVEGLKELQAALRSVPEKLRKRALRNALAAGARVVRDESRANAPVLSAEGARLAAPYRKPGTVRNAISVRTSKIARRAGNVGVFVNVRPAKKGTRGAKSPDDPFYWRWLEFGWNPAGRRTGGRGAAGRRQRREMARSTNPKIRGGFGFLQKGATRLQQALGIFVQKLGPAIAKLNNKGQTP